MSGIVLLILGCGWLVAGVALIVRTERRVHRATLAVTDAVRS